VVDGVDDVLLRGALRLDQAGVGTLQEAALSLRSRRLTRSAAPADLDDRADA
jgi:hypothetical protein